jgi:hypothetical protein
MLPTGYITTPQHLIVDAGELQKSQCKEKRFDFFIFRMSKSAAQGQDGAHWVKVL